MISDVSSGGAVRTTGEHMNYVHLMIIQTETTHNNHTSYTTNRYSTASLKEVSASAFDKSVVSLGHTRKYARKSRDYMRAYRAGARGLGADSAVQIVKSHRSALDSHTAFVMSDSVD